MPHAGAELLILEMMVDIPRMKATLEGSSGAGLPIWVGFSLGPEEGCEADEIGDPIELREGASSEMRFRLRRTTRQLMRW